MCVCVCVCVRVCLFDCVCVCVYVVMLIQHTVQNKDTSVETYQVLLRNTLVIVQDFYACACVRACARARVCARVCAHMPEFNRTTIVQYA